MHKPLPPTGIRIPPSLKEWLSAMAKRNRRSLNAEIVHRLDEARTKENAPEVEGSDALMQ